MSRSRILSTLLFGAVILVPMFLAPLSAGAATTEKASGITITPPFQEVLILPNQTSVAQSFAVTNNNDTTASFNLSAVDMGALDDSGGVVFSGLSADYQQKYGLAKWLRLDQTSFVLAPHKTQSVSFSVINDGSLTPGGHYGAIVVKTAEQIATGQDKVSLSPQAATLLFVRKVGGEKYDLKFAGSTTKTSWWSLPSTIAIRLYNSGNVHVVPRGIVVMKDPFGHEVGRGVINPDSSLILPEHERTYLIALQHPKAIAWPGKYTVSVSYRYDGIDSFQTASFTFKYVGLPFIIFGLMLLTGVAILIRRLWPRLKARLAKRRERKADAKIRPAPRYTHMSLRQLKRPQKKIKIKVK